MAGTECALCGVQCRGKRIRLADAFSRLGLPPPVELEERVPADWRKKRRLESAQLPVRPDATWLHNEEKAAGKNCYLVVKQVWKDHLAVQEGETIAMRLARGGTSENAPVAPPKPPPRTTQARATASVPAPSSLDCSNRYVVVKAAVLPSWLDADALAADAHGPDPDGPIGGDTKRGMKTLPNGLSSLLRGVLMSALAERGLLGERDQMEVRLLVSQPGSAPQHAHCDDDPDDPVYEPGSEGSAMCSGVLALEAGTTLLFFPDGPQGAPKEVRVDAGDLVLFRGDCFHAGAGYARLNRCIYFYLSAPRRRRDVEWKWNYQAPVPPMPAGAFVKEEEFPPMPPGAFVKEEVVVKREHEVVVDEGGRSEGRPKRRKNA